MASQDEVTRGIAECVREGVHGWCLRKESVPIVGSNPVVSKISRFCNNENNPGHYFVIDTPLGKMYVVVSAATPKGG